MNNNGFASREEETEFRMGIYLDTVQAEGIRTLVWSMADSIRAPEDPPIQEPDIEISRSYLKKVILREELREVQGMTRRQFAAVWANGALGAARYRARKAAGGLAQRQLREK